MYKKQMLLFKLGYMINDKENEAEIKKQVTQKRHKQTQAKIWTQTY